MELNKEIRERIFTAADSLHEQSGRESFPTVDAVRKTARVNMNDASAGMKEWRRAQTAQAAPVAVQVPEAVQQANGQALAALWQAAQALANESLRAAQAGWEVERAEADTLNKQLADAHETQAGELATAQARSVELEQLGQQAGEQIQAITTALEDASNGRLGAEQRAGLAEQRAQEVEHRAADLRAELDRAHQDTDRWRTELDAEKIRQAGVSERAEAAAQSHNEQRKAAAQEAHRVVERLTATQGERDQARREAHEAQIQAAELRGRLESLIEQHAKLFEAMQATPDKVIPKGRS